MKAKIRQKRQCTQQKKNVLNLLFRVAQIYNAIHRSPSSKIVYKGMCKNAQQKCNLPMLGDV